MADLCFKPIFRDDSTREQRGSIGTAKTHANLLPTPLPLQKTCHQTAIRLATLPKHHPLRPHLEHVVKHRNISRHRSSLHNLIASFQMYPDDVETINLLQNSVKKQLIDTDGSSHGGGVAAAAVLTREGRTLRILKYHLGSDRKHAVYEAEVVRWDLNELELIYSTLQKKAEIVGDGCGKNFHVRSRLVRSFC
ncbi:hypothetical protein BDR06DRAFT_156437 [Suillus hirtellus]|nr:hypothetical protein BDR06DRAFT_156437 [Suillus hirtellus]